MRRHGFDWLRIGVIFLLFPFHTARVYDVWEPNYVKDAANINDFSSWFVAALGYWIMPLLFFVAGYAAYQALRKRTPGQFVRERVSRLLIPFLVGLVLIVPPQGYLALIQQYGYTGDYLSFLGLYFTNFSDLSGYTGGFTPAHLWFVLYLFVISLALLAPLLWMVRRPDKLKGLARPWLILLAIVPMTLMQALPDIGGKNPFYFGMIFLLGAVFANSDVFIDALRRWRFALLGGALAANGAMLAIAATVGWLEGYSAEAIGFALLRNLGVWLMILALAGLADQYLNKPSKALSIFNRASYPVYIFHQTVLLAAAYFIVMLDMPWTLKFAAIVLAAMGLSWGCYEICRRFKATRFLLGIK